MAIRTIREIGEEILTKTSKPVSKLTLRTKMLIDDMFDTMYESGGVGLAAPQVTYLMHELAAAGIPVSVDATTVAEAKEEILAKLGR